MNSDIVSNCFLMLKQVIDFQAVDSLLLFTGLCLKHYFFVPLSQQIKGSREKFNILSPYIHRSDSFILNKFGQIEASI